MDQHTLLIYDTAISGVIWVVAGILLREIILARDGRMRLILIAFFSVEIWVYGVLIWYLIKNADIIRYETLHIFAIIFTPKFIVKVCFYFYILRQKRLHGSLK